MACISVEVHETGTVDCVYCLLCDMIQRMFELELVVVAPSFLRLWRYNGCVPKHEQDLFDVHGTVHR